MTQFIAGGKQQTYLVLIYAQHCQRLYYKLANIQQSRLFKRHQH